MLKTFWNWLAWQFYKGNADKLLAESQAIVERMDAKQKLGYALNAARKGNALYWSYDFGKSGRYLLSIDTFILWRVKSNVDSINSDAKYYKGQSVAFITDTAKELAYAFWSLQRMLSIAYPNHGFKLEGKVECSDSEALTRIATSIVASVATAYGHERGCRAYDNVYRAMIDYGRGLVE